MGEIRTSDGGRGELRCWTSPDWPVGASPGGGVALEWRGSRPGPTSYGLLGVRRSQVTSLSAPTVGPAFADGMAADAKVGLPTEYHAVVLRALERSPMPIEVCLGCHTDDGSSPIAFVALAWAAESLLTGASTGPDDATEAWRAAFSESVRTSDAKGWPFRSDPI